MASIAALRKKAAVKFGDYVIEDVEVDGEPVTLTHALKLTDEQRDQMANAVDLGDDSTIADVRDFFANWARVVAIKPEHAEALIEAVGGDLTVWTTVQNEWQERTEPGEA